MNVDLAVIGQGAVSPAGVGTKVLLQGHPNPMPIAPLGRPDRPYPVLRVDQRDPAFLHWQKEPRLRRASPITLFLIETAAQALVESTPAERAETGLIVAYSAGCLAYSRRFFEGIVKEGQRTASPALFPETVFNSPGSHVAAVLGLNGAAYALVGDETAWVSALKTAAIWLRQERVRQVLVLGVEEFDPLVLDAYRSARWLRHGFLPGEGAGGVLVRLRGKGGASVIATARDGFTYRTKPQAQATAEKLFQALDPAIPFHPSASRNWLRSLEEKVAATRPPLTSEAPYLGEAFTASAAWHTLRALTLLNSTVSELLVPVWGLNSQLGLLHLTSGA